MNLPRCISYLEHKSRHLLKLSRNSNSQKCYLSNVMILGIETSCDDTASAIVNGEGKLVSEGLYSQNLIHVRNGGIIPDIAQDLHRNYIEPIVAETLTNANLTMRDITAIAVTLEPGLPLSLSVGMKYAKHLARCFNKPIIPIHHMQAHALAARMHYDITFPFIVLLISGGHCLLAIARDVNKFELLGESLDCAPGEILDKIARRMKLRNIPEYSKISGGRAIELAALKSTNQHTFRVPLPLVDSRDCNFSFNGIKTSVLYQIQKKEKEHQIVAHNLIPEVNDLCAAALKATTKHLLHRTQRAMEFCLEYQLLPEDNKQLIVSGGVACNNYIFNSLAMLSKELNFKIFRPLPKLCTDNGVMIAWNGLEKWRSKIDIISDSLDIDKLDIRAVSPLGESLIAKVKESNMCVKRIKIKLQ